MDRPRLNIQPWLNRLCRVAFATSTVGQLVIDMFMQVLIERVRHVARESSYSQLIFLISSSVNRAAYANVQLELVPEP